MPLLRLNEHYTSIQGEGPNVGKLTQFFRFSGCNMRCPGWPCDTPYAIFPHLYKEDPKWSSEHLVNMAFEGMASTGAAHVCLTGGEPFLQDHLQLGDLIRGLRAFGFTIDIFTNGSFLFPSWVTLEGITINFDWKLGGSGEAHTGIENRFQNLELLKQKDAVKFVIKNYDDFQQAVNWTSEYFPHGTPFEVFVGRMWDTEITDADLVEWVKQEKKPWRLNIQTHKLIWPNIERGI